MEPSQGPHEVLRIIHLHLKSNVFQTELLRLT
jgi:hypothetical protein